MQIVDVPPISLTQQEQVIEQKLVACGLEASGITVKYQSYLQGFEIVIRPKAGATPAHFKCIHGAAGNEFVSFEDHGLGGSYSAFADELARPAVIAMLRAEVAKLHLLENFPQRKDYNNLADYARALEVHAKIKPGSALRVYGDMMEFNPPRAELSYPAFSHRYSRIISVAGYAAVLEGITFGFVGNEAVQEK